MAPKRRFTKKNPALRRDLPLLYLAELAILTGLLALAAGVLLLLPGLLATALLLAGLLARVLVLLARILILVRHGRLPG